jgi:hypothetical protein
MSLGLTTDDPEAERQQVRSRELMGPMAYLRRKRAAKFTALFEYLWKKKVFHLYN